MGWASHTLKRWPSTCRGAVADGSHASEDEEKASGPGVNRSMSASEFAAF